MQEWSICADCAVLAHSLLPLPCSTQRVKSAEIAPTRACQFVSEQIFDGFGVLNWQLAQD